MRGKKLKAYGIQSNSTALRRFWAKVDKSGSLPVHCPNLGRCWEWTGALNKGYGFFQPCGKQNPQVKAHRFAWYVAFGDPGGCWVLHRCDNAKCVNPEHLFLGTAKDNSQDREAKGRGRRFCKLTPHTVKEIRLKRTEGLSQGKVAAIFGVSKTLVRMIEHRRIWSHV